MNNAEFALARSRAYALFSRIFMGGIDADALPFLQHLPELAESFDAMSWDADEAAAQHYQLFGLNVFPYESIFLHDDGMLGSVVTEAVQETYRRIGFTPTSSESADHLANELAALAFLVGAEADALSDSEQAQSQRMRHLQRQFLDEHLLRWFPALVQAVHQQDVPYYSELSDVLLRMFIEHRESLGEDLLAQAGEFALPDVPVLLEREKTGLKDIAAFLLTPALSGLYLSREDIRRLGRTVELPHGFGSRQQMLTNLLRVAADYQQLEAVLQQMLELVQQWQRHYDTVAAHSTLQCIAPVWQQRLIHSANMLAQMQAAARDAHNTPVSWLGDESV